MQKSQDIFLKSRGFPGIPGISRNPGINPYPGFLVGMLACTTASNLIDVAIRYGTAILFAQMDNGTLSRVPYPYRTGI